MKCNSNRGFIATFHRWSNKSYAVFLSLRVVVKIGVLSLTYSILVLPTNSFAQKDTSSIKNYDLEEIVINANRKAQTFSELTRVVRVISREEIEKQRVNSLQDLLEKSLMVDIRQRGGQDVQADINIRGGSFDQVLILINGVNITDPQTGHHNLNIPIDLSSIQKIEILQGPGARIYGPGAFSGAINILTYPDSTNRASVATLAGEHSLLGLNISGNLAGKNIASFISASSKQSEGYIDNTDFSQINIYSHNTFKSKLGDIHLFGGYQAKGFGANSFYTKKYPNQYEATSALTSSIQYEKNYKRNKIKLDLFYRGHKDRFELFRSNPAPWYKNHNYHYSTVYGSKLTFQNISRFGRVQLGSELRNEEIVSNVLGKSLSKPRKISGTDSLFYSKGDFRKHMILFADYSYYFDKFSISTGMLFTTSNSFDNKWIYGIDLSYIISKYFKTFASINKTYRNPTFTDIYYIGPTNIGNLNIKPEEAITYELGIKYQNSWFNGYSSIFYRDGKNIIDWVKLPSEEKWQSQNYTQLGTTGFEIGMVALFRKTIIKDISVNYAYLKSSKSSGLYDSYYALDYLNHNLNLKINNKLISNLSAEWTISYQDRVGTYIDFSSNKNTLYPSVLMLDLKVQWSGKKLSAYIDANNIFNTNYFDIANVQQPGRWVMVGIIYKFHW